MTCADPLDPKEEVPFPSHCGPIYRFTNFLPTRRVERIGEIIFSIVNDLYCQNSIFFFYLQDNRVHIGPKMEMRVVTLGLDNSGKTSMLFKLKQNEFITQIPTIGFNVETVEYKNLKFTIWDVGGQPKLRPLWKHYYLNTQVGEAYSA